MTQTINNAILINQTSGKQNWWTPINVIEAARRTLGAISLDPASSSAANQRVKAFHYFTVDVEHSRENAKQGIFSGCVCSQNAGDSFIGPDYFNHHGVGIQFLAAEYWAIDLSPRQTTTARASVHEFGRLMEWILAYHDKTKRGWTDANPLWLMAKLSEETGELAQALTKLIRPDGTVDVMTEISGYNASMITAHVAREAIDVANVALMIADLMGMATKAHAERDPEQSHG